MLSSQPAQGIKFISPDCIDENGNSAAFRVDVFSEAILSGFILKEGVHVVTEKITLKKIVLGIFIIVSY